MADTEPSSKPKRKLRAPSQTVRQQAEQATVIAEKPKKVSTFKKASQSIAKPLAGIGRALDRQPFRFIAKIFRFIGHILIPPFVRNAYKELKLVEWPSRKETRQLTFAVLLFAIVFGVTIAIVDYGLDKLFRTILLK